MSWEKVSLDKICTMLSGNAWTASKFKDEGQIPIIRIQNLGNNENEKFIWWDESYDKKYIVNKGDILLSLSGSIKVDVWNGIDALLNQRIVKLIPNKNIHHKWFYWQITNIILDIERMGKWALVNNVAITDLKDLEIPLPPIATQKRIAEILDAADALRRKDQELLKKYDELAQAIFIDMFGNPVKNEKGCDVKSLDKITTKLGDGIHGTPNYSMDGKYYFINGNNLENGTIVVNESTKKVDENEFLKHKKELNENTMLVSINGTIGKVAFYKGENIILGKSACYFNIDKTQVSPIYLYSLIKSNYFVHYAGENATGSTIKNVSLKTMREFPVPLPPLSKQMIYDEQITLIWESIKIVNRNDEKLLFNSLINKAFKGELVA